MKKLLAALTLALLVSVALGASVASATHSNGAGPKNDFVTGTGQFSPETVDQQVHVNAKSGPSGEDPQGYFFVTGTSDQGQPIDFRVRVTCLFVNGNIATVGGEIERSRTSAVPVGAGFVLFIRDSGEPGDGDVFAGGDVSTPPETCPPLVPTMPQPINQGNFVVHDAAP
jgi:hypothetical protein